MENENFNIEYDHFFKKCEKLKWLPFVGENYTEQENKTIFIGESHYYNPKKEDERALAFEEIFTRLIVRDGGLLELSYSSELYKNINRIYSNIEKKSLWNKVSYFNFIQRPMNTIAEKPNKKDFLEGWSSFLEAIKVLKPDNCIFWGNSAAEYFNKFCQNEKIEHLKIERLEKINGAYFKTSELTLSNKVIKLYFLKHPAKYFSVDKWRNKLIEIGLLNLN